MAAAAARVRIQNPAVLRKDPKARSFDGVPELELTNKDPKKTYKLVALSARFHGPDYYQATGWEKEIASEHGVRFKFMNVSRIGEPIMFWDMLLMSIDNDVQLERDREGQMQADERESAMIKERGGFDGFRGVGTYLTVENQVQAAEIENG